MNNRIFNVVATAGREVQRRRNCFFNPLAIFVGNGLQGHRQFDFLLRWQTEPFLQPIVSLELVCDRVVIPGGQFCHLNGKMQLVFTVGEFF